MEVGTEKCLLSRVCPKLTAYFVHKCHIEWPFDNQLYVYYNYGALVAILFSFAYSLFALYDVLINIFNMGQFATALTRKRLKSMRNDKRRDTNE